MRPRLLVAQLGHPDHLVVVADRETQNVPERENVFLKYPEIQFSRPCFEAGLLVAALVEQRVVVDVVDVDQLPGVDDVAHDASGEREPHLILLKIQKSKL